MIGRFIGPTCISCGGLGNPVDPPPITRDGTSVHGGAGETYQSSGADRCAGSCLDIDHDRDVNNGHDDGNGCHRVGGAKRQGRCHHTGDGIVVHRGVVQEGCTGLTRSGNVVDIPLIGRVWSAEDRGGVEGDRGKHAYRVSGGYRQHIRREGRTHLHDDRLRHDRVPGNTLGIGGHQALYVIRISGYVLVCLVGLPAQGNCIYVPLKCRGSPPVHGCGRKCDWAAQAGGVHGGSHGNSHCLNAVHLHGDGV